MKSDKEVLFDYGEKDFPAGQRIYGKGRILINAGADFFYHEAKKNMKKISLVS